MRTRHLLSILLAAAAACAPGGLAQRGSEHSVPRAPGDVASWRILAEMCHRERDYAGEREALEQLVALVPDDATAWYALGRATRGDDEKRLAAWQRAARLDSTYWEPRFAIGSMLGAERRTAAQAIPWFDEAAKLGNRGETFYWRGRALLALERWAEAHDAFVASAQTGWRHASWAWGGAGFALSRAGRHAEALDAWDRALALDMNHLNPMGRDFGMVVGERSAWKRSRKAVGRD